MEDSFAIQLLEAFKGFEFQTLWNVKDKLFQFQRTASEAAPGTNNLQGIVQLTKSLEKLDKLKQKTQQCFTKFKHSTDILKWSFNNVNNTLVSIIAHECENILRSLLASNLCRYTCMYRTRLFRQSCDKLMSVFR